MSRQRFTDYPELIKIATSGALRREIPDDYTYNPKKAKHLKHILHNVSVALGTLTSALNEFSRVKSPEISPDGKLGGIGYIIPVKDIKQSINTSVHALSNVADCIADELTNPRWSIAEEKEVKDLIKEKDDAIEQVEESPANDDIKNDDIVTVNEDKEDKDPVNLEKKDQDKLASAVSQSLVNYFKGV
jgi:hypothetical protein